MSSGPWDTVPFRLIWLSRITRPVVLAEFHHQSRVTAPLAEDIWRIRKTVKKGFFEKYLQLWVILNVLYFSVGWSMINIFDVQEKSRKSDLILARGCRDFKKRPRVDFFGNECWAELPNVIRHCGTCLL